MCSEAAKIAKGDRVSLMSRSGDMSRDVSQRHEPEI